MSAGSSSLSGCSVQTLAPGGEKLSSSRLAQALRLALHSEADACGASIWDILRPDMKLSAMFAIWSRMPGDGYGGGGVSCLDEGLDRF